MRRRMVRKWLPLIVKSLSTIYLLEAPLLIGFA